MQRTLTTDPQAVNVRCMTNEPDTTDTPAEWLARIQSAAFASRGAMLDLELLLLECARSDAWEAISYRELAEVLGVSRQGAAQRIDRILAAHQYGVRP